MAKKLSGKLSSLIHQMGRDREDRLFSGETKLTVTAIFLIDDNWKVFKEYRDIIGKPLRQEEDVEMQGSTIWICHIRLSGMRYTKDNRLLL
jgi:hypothetical protein